MMTNSQTMVGTRSETQSPYCCIRCERAVAEPGTLCPVCVRELDDRREPPADEALANRAS